MPTVSGPFFAQFLSDGLFLLRLTRTLSNLRLSSAVCKTTTVDLQPLDMNQLRAGRRPDTAQFPLAQTGETPERNAG